VKIGENSTLFYPEKGQKGSGFRVKEVFRIITKNFSVYRVGSG
jgi:hypothetical protein